jgi:predicted sulfurtransferase
LGELKAVWRGKLFVFERRSWLTSGNKRPDVCSSSVTESSCVVGLLVYADGFNVVAAVLRSRPSILTALRAA